MTRFDEVKQICNENGIEIIPIIFSVGYGGSALSHNPNLAAGLFVKDALFVVDGDRANLIPDPEVRVMNCGFEEFEGNLF